jgi:MinD superfamily P-loop ATPase
MPHYIMEDCIICGTCWEVCPLDAIEEHRDYYLINDKCNDCGLCLKPCPNKSITKTVKKGQFLEIRARDAKH